MCCIFTCLAWFIDLVQRCWTFTMSCCIAAAITCTFLTGSISGVALGYNYSLAEYIDLKETNVSVYLKRGVFDDDIVDDMDWRRSGKHKAIEQGLLKEDNLITENAERRQAPQAGRRMDDSIFISDDHHRFEGGLMKLTVKPPDYTSTATTMPYDITLQNYAPESGEEMKNVQAQLNKRKMNSARLITSSRRDTVTPTRPLDELRQPVGIKLESPGDRRMAMQLPGSLYGLDPSARAAVPGADIGNNPYWILPKLPPKYRVTYQPDEIVTFPTPVTMRGPLRPVRPAPPQTSKAVPRSNTPEKSFDEQMRNFQQDLMKETATENMEYRRMNKGKDLPASSDEYDEEIKGLPVRRRRRNALDTTGYNRHNANSAENDTEDKSYKTRLINKIVKLINQLYNKIKKTTQTADSLQEVKKNYNKLLADTIFVTKLLKI